MLKSISLTISPVYRSVYNIANNPACVQCVRWHRKPRWIPVAKSKMFRAPERKQQNEDERVELLRLNNNYKTKIRSIRSYLFDEVKRIRETSTADHIILTPEQEEAQTIECETINNEWNLMCGKFRDERLMREKEEKIKYAEERLALKEERDRDRQERIEKLIRLEKERSKTYITKEKLNDAIEYALANPVDYNFALDLRGNMYSGRMGTEPIAMKNDNESETSEQKHLSTG